MNINLDIEKVDIKDVVILQKICRTTFYESFADYNTEEDMHHYLAHNFSAEKLLSELRNPNSTFYFAIHNDDLIGYMKINKGTSKSELLEGENLEIERLYVLEEFQGKGVGKKLMFQAREIALQYGYDYIWLGVWSKNTKAVEFYEKIGFEKFDEHTFQLGEDPQLDYLMRLKL